MTGSRSWGWVVTLMVAAAATAAEPATAQLRPGIAGGVFLSRTFGGSLDANGAAWLSLADRRGGVRFEASGMVAFPEVDEGDVAFGPSFGAAYVIPSGAFSVGAGPAALIPFGDSNNFWPGGYLRLTWVMFRTGGAGVQLHAQEFFVNSDNGLWRRFGAGVGIIALP